MKSRPVKGRQTSAAATQTGGDRGQDARRIGAAVARRDATGAGSRSRPGRRGCRAGSWSGPRGRRRPRPVSRRSRISARSPSSRKIEPTTSAWPQIALLNQVIGLTRTIAAAMMARRWEAPSSWAMPKTRYARARSPKIGISLIASPTPPGGLKMQAEDPQEEQIDGRVVEEARLVVEARAASGRRAGRSSPGRKRGRRGSPTPEARTYAMMRRRARPRTRRTTMVGTDELQILARSRRRVPPRAGLSHARACQPKRPPGRALRWSGV